MPTEFPSPMQLALPAEAPRARSVAAILRAVASFQAQRVAVDG